jgi:hypothetical protein
MVLSSSPDLIPLLEHWLTPCNLDRFKIEFPGYLCFDTSAMNTVIEIGVLGGRPLGGVMILAKHSLTQFINTLCANVRLVVLKIGNILFGNVYLSYVGTVLATGKLLWRSCGLKLMSG